MLGGANAFEFVRSVSLGSASAKAGGHHGPAVLRNRTIAQPHAIANIAEFMTSLAGGSNLVHILASGTGASPGGGYSLKDLEIGRGTTTHTAGSYLSLDGGKSSIELIGVHPLKGTDHGFKP
jgi:hypothetical protein